MSLFPGIGSIGVCSDAHYVHGTEATTEGETQAIAEESTSGPCAAHPGTVFVPFLRAPGADLNTWQGLMKINASTGEMTAIYKGRAPTNGAVLTTAGDLVFWGDLDHKFRAFDADSGKILWETTLNGPVQNSTMTYAVNGKQYIAVLTGMGLMSGGLMDQAGIKPNRTYNALYVFALPDRAANTK